MANNPSLSAALAVVMVAAAAFFVAANAQASPMAAPALPPSLVPAPSPALDCMSYLVNLSDCLDYVQKGSQLKKPDKHCCPEVENLLQTEPICLCELLANPGQSPFPIDVPRALGLPSVCKLDMSFGNPASACAVLGVPIGAPAPAPASSSSQEGPSPPFGTTVLPPEGSAASAPGSPNNDGQRIAGSQTHLLLGLALLVLASFF